MLLEKQMKKSLFDAQRVVIDRINGCETVDCFDLDCEELTGGYQLESLRNVVSEIRDRRKRIAMVKACKSQFELHMIRTDHEAYQETWDWGCAFKTYCDKLIWNLEEGDAFVARNELAARVKTEHEKVLAIMESDKAKALLARIPPMYYDGKRWLKETPKTIISQFVQILSGILRVPDRKKWVCFELYWNIAGLSKAFYSRNGRGLDKEIKSLFPEYEGV